MKQTLLALVTLSAVVLACPAAGAQTPAAKPAAPKPLKLVKIATITGAAANREFQANVQLLQGQRQAAVELTEAIKKENDPKKKKEMTARLDALLAKLNENNAAMEKAYGFSLARNYTMEIEVANIYMVVTEDEAAKIEQQQKAASKAKK